MLWGCTKTTGYQYLWYCVGIYESGVTKLFYLNKTFIYMSAQLKPSCMSNGIIPKEIRLSSIVMVYKKSNTIIGCGVSPLKIGW